MTGDPRRPYHHGNLREALLQAAEAQIEIQEVQNLSLRAISRGLGVSHASTGRHFADKRALLDAVAERGFKQLGTELSEAAVDRSSGFDARLTRLAQAHASFALRRPVLFRWMFEAVSRADAPSALRAAHDRALSHASRLFREGQAAGAVVGGDPERVGLAGFAAIQGLVSISIGGSFGGTPLEDLVPEVIERVILGLRPRS